MFTSFHGISENTSNDTRPELDWRRNARVKLSRVNVTKGCIGEDPVTSRDLDSWIGLYRGGEGKGDKS